MPTQLRLPMQPADADAINATVAVLRRDGHVAYFAAGVPLCTHRDADAVGQRIAAVQLMELGLARQDELSAALRVNRTTLYRQHQKLKGAVPSAIIPHELNYLLNPLHPHVKRVRIGRPEPFSLDPRLWKP